jgi:hypothetical protein
VLSVGACVAVCEGRVVFGVVCAVVEPEGDTLSPSPDETMIATTTPARAAAATAAASRAFFTGSEATLGPPWPVGSKSS